MTPAQSGPFHYQGDELRVFAAARNWKQYWLSCVAPYVKGDVLEVGAGAGANTELMRPLCRGCYVSLEPDSDLLKQAREQLSKSKLKTVFRVGTVADLGPDDLFDTAVYIDVLEHIEDDAAELALVARHLRPGGHIVVLSPAHQFLYSAFDRAIGHFRRYNRSSLARCTPPGATLLRICYLDSLGGLLSLANRLLLRQGCPSPAQILFWDRVVIPASRAIDGLLGFRVGKSILGVWSVNRESLR